MWQFEHSIKAKVMITGPNAEQLGPKFVAHMFEGIPHTLEGLAALALDKERPVGA